MGQILLETMVIYAENRKVMNGFAKGKLCLSNLTVSTKFLSFYYTYTIGGEWKSN